MIYLNEYDLARCERNLDPAVVPNRAAVLAIIIRLKDWTNATSDGWAYWLPPRRAAKTAMGLVYGSTNALEDAMAKADATDAVTKRALSPVKAFLTRCERADMITPAEREYILTGNDMGMGA
jgi:hypothetical protein